MGVLWHCPDGVFELPFVGRRRWQQEREGRVGTTCFERCGHPGRCWPSGRGCQTMTRRDYSVALLFQHVTWTALQFRRLRVTVMIASLFLKRALHSMLPPVAAVAIGHTFEKYCGGGGSGGTWGGSTDFAALAVPYIFAFHLAMGV